MDTSIQTYRGALALVGPAVDDVAKSTLTVSTEGFTPISSGYHITIATKEELKSLTPEQHLQATSSIPDTRHIFSAGLGGKPKIGAYWVVIIWAAGQQIRKRLGLPAKHFHITLSSNDVHDVDKGVASLLGKADPFVPRSAEFLDHTAFTLFALGQHDLALEYCSRLILLDPTSQKGFLRTGDVWLAQNRDKLAMLAFASAYDRTGEDKIRKYCLKKLVECSKETEWGPVFQEHELVQLDYVKDISAFLLTPWSDNLREALTDLSLQPSLVLEPRQSLFIPSTSPASTFYKLLRFFRWIVPYHLAVMSTPRNEDDIIALSSSHLGIRHILTLTEETPLPTSWFRNKKITNTFLPISNFRPPSIEQMDVVMKLFDESKNLPLLVHCGGGKGRAGTVIACYLAAFGFRKPVPYQDHPEIPAVEAISLLRSLRPGSLETTQQEAFVSKWCSTIWKRQSIYPDVPSEPPPCPMEIEGSIPQVFDMVVLVGLPGSGKSWFSNSLLAREPAKWLRVSQDDSGSRSACETDIGHDPKGKRVLLDRCNTAATDRKLWLQLAANWCMAPICIWFDYDKELCASRAQMRAGHPTLPPGSRVRNAVEQMQKVFVRPTLQEGFKAIVVVRSIAAAQDAILRLSTPLSILKFPRTPHLIDVGAATSDDVHVDVASFASAQDHVIITEKIDGANMGFSLSSDRSRVLVQNRSHYVNSATHEQFKKLGLWVERHEDELRNILDRDAYFPERYILYGEWMFATHSIPYSDLPDYFIAYDIFDRATQSWADTNALHALLEGTTIASVPILYEGNMPSEAELLTMIQSGSRFYDGRVEGVYVKVEANGRIKSRGKVVRSDFIAGNEHWTRGGLRQNTLRLQNDTNIV
ncbi:ATP dependent DNA ligase [Pholiota conissans]|uniref:ATP dependent DNA ligase n=1 Tax=Pholiota conissans TaxID=109636 RepID=A0A9P6CZ41_9AGAR|nr:ATP dependent DNA ligase [Pholiota conissans]